MDRILTPLELAFIGDAIHTLFVRNWAIQNYNKPINEIHLICSKFCSAVHQSKVLNSLNLTEEEKDIVRKARNVKIKHSAKNAEIKDYKSATSFEALIGYLNITNQIKRLNEILLISVK